MTCNPIKVNFVKSYDELVGKPSINGVTLEGNISFDDLGLSEWLKEETRDFVTNSLTTTKIKSSSADGLEISSDNEIQISGKSVNISTVGVLGVLCDDGSGSSYDFTFSPDTWHRVRTLADTYYGDYYYFTNKIWSWSGFTVGDPTLGFTDGYWSPGEFCMYDIFGTGGTSFYASSQTFSVVTNEGSNSIWSDSSGIGISSSSGVVINNVLDFNVIARGADGYYTWTISSEEWNKLHELVLNA